MGRKVMLTGVMIFFRPGSVQQLLVGGLIAAFYMGRRCKKVPVRLALRQQLVSTATRNHDCA